MGIIDYGNEINTQKLISINTATSTVYPDSSYLQPPTPNTFRHYP